MPVAPWPQEEWADGWKVIGVFFPFSLIGQLCPARVDCPACRKHCQQCNLILGQKPRTKACPHMTLSLASCWGFGHKCGHKDTPANEWWLHTLHSFRADFSRSAKEEVRSKAPSYFHLGEQEALGDYGLTWQDVPATRSWNRSSSGQPDSSDHPSRKTSCLELAWQRRIEGALGKREQERDWVAKPPCLSGWYIL
jgi:hypothetical protein